jgi:hypothetical protein
VNAGEQVTSKYHPLDAERLVNVLKQLHETHGPRNWDVSVTHHVGRRLLVTESDQPKLWGHIGSIRSDHLEEDCHDVVRAALLR